MIPDSPDHPPAIPPANSLPPQPQAAAREIWYSEELLGTRREVLIKHGDEIYRLRCTRQGKLILNK